MPIIEWNITLVSRTLDDSVLVTEPLLFPEIRFCGSKIISSRRAVRSLLVRLLRDENAHGLHARVLPSTAETAEIKFVLEPPSRSVDWETPIELRFDVVHWQYQPSGYVAFVPELGIDVIAQRKADLHKLLGEQILTTLRRTKISESLFQIALTQRVTRRANLKALRLKVSHKSPKQLVRGGKEDEKSALKPVIAEAGVVLGELPLKPAYEIEKVLSQLADALGGRSPSSVLLIGTSGVGKTAAVHELVRQKAAHGFSSTPFWSTSGSRLIAGTAGFGMWQQRCQRLCREASRDSAIIHIGNLVELMQVGRIGGSQGIAGFFKAPLNGGDLLVIAECTPEQLTLIEREDPSLLNLFYQLRLEEPEHETGRSILRQVAAAHTGTVPISETALDALDRLHRRYATYSAAPGRPVRFLQNLLQDQAASSEITAADVIARFSRETGLPLTMLDPDIPLDLLDVRRWFASKLIAQQQAIGLVCDLLATVKAALTRPRRPIASLLFVGPTGVGKTELAKALAEYFFGDRKRLTRFDMSEFATPASVERLIGGTDDGHGLLTAKVREQPFAVILLDEFEKAHHSFFDLLLQVLGEGRLTDSAGRVGDFSNAIVIMTSNLGAESFGRGSFGLNREDARRDAAGHFTDEVKSFLRPELFNRIDRIVPFLPLDIDAILQIAERELSLVQQRDGFKLRGLSMEVTAAARQYLAEKGYDVRYGARPLKRAIERQLLAPLAEALSTYASDIQLQAQTSLINNALSIEVRADLDEKGRTLSATASGSSAAGVAELAAVLRRDVQRLLACPEKKDRMVRLDMSEYTGYAAVERLIGPAGGEPSEFIKQMRDQPFNVVLLDEIEKASPEVFDLLLGVFDEGRLTDRFGRLTTFRSALIIMTSNLGASTGEPFGLSAQRTTSYESEVAAFFRPEFFNRIDAVVPFQPLELKSIQRLAEGELQKTSTREGLLHRKICLLWTDAVVGLLCQLGYDPRYGARPLQRTIEQLIVTPLAKLLVKQPDIRNRDLQISIGPDGQIAMRFSNV